MHNGLYVPGAYTHTHKHTIALELVTVTVILVNPQGLRKCKELKAIAQVHAENGEAVSAVWSAFRNLYVYQLARRKKTMNIPLDEMNSQGQSYVYGELGVTKPYGHALSRPAEVEVEATARSIKLAELVDTPIYVVHVMSKGAMEEVYRQLFSPPRSLPGSIGDA